MQFSGHEDYTKYKYNTYLDILEAKLMRQTKLINF